MSQSQELESAYEELNNLNPGLDVWELIYGVDGYFYNNFPKEWNEKYSIIYHEDAPVNDNNWNARSNFDGDIIYCERLWNDFKKWARKEKRLNIYDFSSKN